MDRRGFRRSGVHRPVRRHHQVGIRSVSLWDEIRETDRLMSLALSEAKKRGDALWRAEAAYYTAKAKAAFELKGQGNSATFIEMVIKGVPDVADAMAKYHAAQVEYDNAKEAVNVYKKRLTYLNEQYAREWGQAGKEI